MKINYKNTALNLLDKWDEEVNVPEGHRPMTTQDDRKFGTSILNYLPKLAPLFKKKIQYISMPFFEAYLKGKHKLVDIFDKEEMDESGTFIWQVGGSTLTNFYYVNASIIDGVWNAQYLLIQFSKQAKNDFKSIDVYVSAKMNEEEKCLEEKTFIYKGNYDKGMDHDYYAAWLITFVLFIKHVQLETKVVSAGKKAHHAGEKYVNETKSNIEVLDSSWFTTIVRSEGFSVGADTGGFFRWQPKGPGRAERELIWVMPFEKQGYIREAKILKQ